MLKPNALTRKEATNIRWKETWPVAANIGANLGQAHLTNKGLKAAEKNNVLDWNTLQGYDYASNETIQQARHLDFRHILIDNATEYSIGVAITASPDFAGKAQFTLRPGETRDLAINEFNPMPPSKITTDEDKFLPIAIKQSRHQLVDDYSGKPPSQYIHLFTSKGEVGNKWIIRSDSNQFVIRYNEMYGGLFVERYYRPTQRA